MSIPWVFLEPPSAIQIGHIIGHIFSPSRALMCSRRQSLHVTWPQPSTLTVSSRVSGSVQIKQSPRFIFGLRSPTTDTSVFISLSIPLVSQRTTSKRMFLAVFGMKADELVEEALACADRTSALTACWSPAVARSSAASSGASFALNADGVVFGTAHESVCLG